MKFLLSIIPFFFVCIVNSYSQSLNAEEKIKVLQTAKQSVEVIDFVVQGDFAFPEINQANQLKHKGVKDEIIFYVLSTHAKLTEIEINDLYGYQQDSLPTSVINKTIDEKPKFIESLKEKSKQYPIQTKYKSDNYEPVKKAQKIGYEETIGLPLHKEKIIASAKKWLAKYKQKKEAIQIVNDTTISVKCKFILTQQNDPAMGMWANEPTATFNVFFTCSNGFYSYKIDNIIMAYYYGNEPTNLNEGPIEKMKGYGVMGKFKDELHTKIVQMINDINTFVVE